MKSLLLCQVVWLKGRIWQKIKVKRLITYKVFLKINYYLSLKFNLLENSEFKYLTISLTIFTSVIAILHYVTWRPHVLFGYRYWSIYQCQILSFKVLSNLDHSNFVQCLPYKKLSFFINNHIILINIFPYLFESHWSRIDRKWIQNLIQWPMLEPQNLSPQYF